MLSKSIVDLKFLPYYYLNDEKSPLFRLLKVSGMPIFVLFYVFDVHSCVLEMGKTDHIGDLLKI